MATKKQPIKVKEGGLHTALGIKQDEDIPKSDLDKLKSAKVGDHVRLSNGKLITITGHMKKMVNFAINFGH